MLQGLQSSQGARERRVLLEGQRALGWDCSCPAPQAMGYLPERRVNWNKMAFTPPSSRAMPHLPGLGVLCPHCGNLWGLGAVSHAVGKGRETGHLYELVSVSLSCAVRPPHTHICWGEGGFVSSFGPYRKELGQGEGERRRWNSGRTLCLGKAVALIQNDPFKRAM